ncbi:MAG: translation initiation factor Sui1 [Desulfobulbaceae bacterium]|nr:translation initiation factor Sui1 [Desulfobulbaceae bacterium]
MPKRDDNNGGLVYSTEHGRLCPGCGKARGQCGCKVEKKRPVKADGIVRLSLETKGRKGKGVTLVTGLLLADDDLRQMAKRLKQQCGSGGTVKDGVVEIQGDHRQPLLVELQKQGYTVKLAGG